MNALLDNILERPPAQKIGILAVLVVLIFALFYSFLYNPRSDMITALAESVESAEKDKASKQRLAANLPKLQSELRELDVQLKQAVAQLPNKKEMSDILNNIANKAQESGLEVLLFRPRAENFQDFYAEVPVDITVKGKFVNAVSFFDQVGRLNRLINIDNIGFKSTVAGDQVILETTSVATAFRFLDEAERKRIADEKARAAKEKK